MSKLGRYFKNIPAQYRAFSIKNDANIPGQLRSGTGKGGGGEEPIGAAEGPFGKIEAATQEEFHKLQQMLLVAFKNTLGKENCLRNEVIDEHKFAIEENDKLKSEIDLKLNDCDQLLDVCRQKLPGHHRRQRDDATNPLDFIFD